MNVKPVLIAGISSIVLIAMDAGTATGQNYPNKAIHIYASAIGGGADIAARFIAQELTGSLGQQVIVENRGGTGLIAADLVAKAPPDGYTLLVYGPPFWIGPLLQKASYDPVRDFLPVTLAISSPNILVVHPSLPAKSVKELIALAKAKPGALNYSTGQTGSSNHLAAELFRAMADVKMVRVNYKSAATALNDLIAGQVQLSFASAPAVAPHVKSGRLRALAVTSAQRSTTFPELPTIAASGVPGYESVSIIAIFAPAKTPEAIINRLNQEIARVLSRPDIKEKFLDMGAETVGSSPGELAATMKSDIARMGKVIKDAGIREE